MPRFKTESIYAKLYVKGSHRTAMTPRVDRPYRPRVIAWHGPDAFYPNRFYEIDNWYKARIERPELFPNLHIIDPDLYVSTFEEKFVKLPQQQTINIGFKHVADEFQGMNAHDEPTILDSNMKKLGLIDLNIPVLNSFFITNHYNVFEDLFMPDVFFHNTQTFDVSYEAEATNSLQENSLTVYFGNIVRTMNTRFSPKVNIGSIHDFDGSNETEGTQMSDILHSQPRYNTLVMVNLEGNGLASFGDDEAGNDSLTSMPHIEGKNTSIPPKRKFIKNKYVPKNLLDEQKQIITQMKQSQMVHWMIGNIPSHSGANTNDVKIENGELIVPYLQPIPYYGTGYHRIAFVLFRHKNTIDFSSYQLKTDDIESRSFHMGSFYKSFENEMTPSALRFCLTKWDESCDAALKHLGMKIPRYWYDWNEDLRPEQREFPKKSMPFNDYLDMYRDPKFVRKEVERKRLKMLLKLPRGEKLLPQKYPDIFYRDNQRKKLPYFLQKNLIKQNIGDGVWARLYYDYQNPAEQHEQQMPVYKEAEVKTDDPIFQRRTYKI